MALALALALAMAMALAIIDGCRYRRRGANRNNCRGWNALLCSCEKTARSKCHTTGVGGGTTKTAAEGGWMMMGKRDKLILKEVKKKIDKASIQELEECLIFLEGYEAAHPPQSGEQQKGAGK